MMILSVKQFTRLPRYRPSQSALATLVCCHEGEQMAPKRDNLPSVFVQTETERGPLARNQIPCARRLVAAGLRHFLDV